MSSAWSISSASVCQRGTPWRPAIFCQCGGAPHHRDQLTTRNPLKRGTALDLGHVAATDDSPAHGRVRSGNALVHWPAHATTCPFMRECRNGPHVDAGHRGQLLVSQCLGPARVVCDTPAPWIIGSPSYRFQNSTAGRRASSSIDHRSHAFPATGATAAIFVFRRPWKQTSQPTPRSSRQLNALAAS